MEELILRYELRSRQVVHARGIERNGIDDDCIDYGGRGDGMPTGEQPAFFLEPISVSKVVKNQ